MLYPKPLFKVTHVSLLQRGKTYIIVYQQHRITWWIFKFNAFLVMRKYIKRGIYKNKDIQFNNHDQVKQYLLEKFHLVYG